SVSNNSQIYPVRVEKITHELIVLGPPVLLAGQDNAHSHINIVLIDVVGSSMRLVSPLVALWKIWPQFLVKMLWLGSGEQNKFGHVRLCRRDRNRECQIIVAGNVGVLLFEKVCGERCLRILGKKEKEHEHCVVDSDRLAICPLSLWIDLHVDGFVLIVD